MSSEDIQLECRLMMGDQIIGTAELRYVDVSMGVMEGELRPLEAYAGPVFDFARASARCSRGDLSFAELDQLRSTIPLHVELADGRRVPRFWFSIEDWTDELPDEAPVLAVCTTNPDDLQAWLDGRLNLAENLE